MDLIRKLVDQEKCRFLIGLLDNNGVDMFFQKMDVNGNTLLAYCVCNKPKMADLLLQYINANVKCNKVKNNLLNQVNDRGESLLYLSVKSKNCDLSKKLFNSGVLDSHVTNKGEKIRVKNDNNNKNNNNKMNDEYNNMSFSNNEPQMSNQKLRYNEQQLFNNEPQYIQLVNVEPKQLQLFNYEYKDEYKDKDTEEFLNNILKQFKKIDKSRGYIGGNNDNVNNNVINNNVNNNGDTETIMSLDFNRNDINDEYNGGRKKKHKKTSKSTHKKTSRGKFKKQSSELHDKTVDEIVKLGKSIEEAQLIKAGLYSMVKEQFPDLNNRARAEKMLEMVTLENIKNIDLNKLKKLIEKNKKDKEKNKDKVEKKEKKERK